MKHLILLVELKLCRQNKSMELINEEIEKYQNKWEEINKNKTV